MYGKRQNDKGSYYVWMFVLFVLSLPGLLIDEEYTKFSSPDNKQNFIVIESGVGKLYKLSNSGLYMTFITTIRTDDGYKPFKDGGYKLEWISSDELVIHYAYDYMDKNNYENYEEISILLK